MKSFLATLPARSAGALGACALLSLAVWLSACGSEEPPAAPAETPAAGSPAPPPGPAAEQRSADDIYGRRQGDVEFEEEGGNPVRFKGQNEAGQAFEASIGENVEVPDSFPDDVPRYSAARPMAAMSAAGEGTVVTFQSADDQQQIYDFYKSQLDANGWSIDGEKEFGGQRSIDASKDTRKLSVSITGTRGDSRISIIVTGAN